MTAAIHSKAAGRYGLRGNCVPLVTLLRGGDRSGAPHAKHLELQERLPLRLRLWSSCASSAPLTCTARRAFSPAPCTCTATTYQFPLRQRRNSHLCIRMLEH